MHDDLGSETLDQCADDRIRNRGDQIDEATAPLRVRYGERDDHAPQPADLRVAEHHLPVGEDVGSADLNLARRAADYGVTIGGAVGVAIGATGSLLLGVLLMLVGSLLLTGASLSFAYETIFMVMRNFPWCTQTGEIAGFAAGRCIETGIGPKELDWSTPYF